MSNPAELPGSTLPLFPPGELPEGAELLLTPEQQRERYPLTTIERHQEKLNAAIMLLGANAPKKYIIETLHIGWYTLQQIAERHGEKITHIKKRCAAKGALYVELGLEQMLEDLQAGRVDPDRLPFNVKLVGDMVQLLTGDATMIVGSASDQGQRLNVDTLKSKLAGMKRVAPVVDAQLVETTHSPAQEITNTREPGATGADLPSEGSNV